MRPWLCALAMLVAVTLGVVGIAGNDQAGSRPTAADAASPANVPVPAWCASDHEPSIPALDHEMPPGMQMDMVMPAITGEACSYLVRQLTVAAGVADRVPTLAAALAAGYHAVGFYGPGVGLHMERPEGVGTVFDPAAPAYLLFDGMTPTARLAGLAYQLDDPAGVPDFFLGDHDMAHSHAYCPRRPGWADDRVPGQPGCTRDNAREGHRWMIHVWVIPGHSSPWGVFSSVNPNLTLHGWNTQAPMSAAELSCAYEEVRTAACRGTVPAVTSGQ